MNSEILAGLQSDITDAIAFFTSQATTQLDQALTCGTNVLASQASLYSFITDAYRSGSVTQITAFKNFFEQLLASLKEVTGCTGTLDCAGDCNGQAILHSTCNVCYGGNANVSSVSEFLDCNNECFGNATTNNCGECYGGSTGRNETYGVDSCNGQCTGKPGFVSSTDCNGVCNGTAIIDSCSQQCVGGDTGRTAAQFRDCNNICNGTGVNDTCGFCVADGTQGPTGSLYQDCTSTCFTPGTLSQMAYINTCTQCVGGNTGKAADAGTDACGVCGGDNSTCLDCAGVPNGGQTLDACGVCGGDGTSCLAVTTIVPDYVPSQTVKAATLNGAGLNGASLECVLVDVSTTTETSVTINTRSNTQLTISLPALAVGTYNATCRQSSGQGLATTTAILTVYNANTVTMASVSPTKFTKSGGYEDLVFSGSGFVTGHTYCHIKVGSSAATTFPATVSSSTSANCNVSHPASSTEILVSLSLNTIDKLGSDITVTAEAAAPTVTSAAFTNSGEKIIVTFSGGVATTTLTTCSAVFQDVTSLGSSATCTFQSRSVMVIETTTVAIGASLTLKTDAVKAYGESFAIAASGTVTFAKGSNPVTPVGFIWGSNKIGSCSDLKVNAFGSKGGGGRALTYTWTVTPSTGLTLSGQGTVSLVVTGTMSGVTYTVALTVCNFMNECDNTPTLSVEKLSTALPDVFVTANTDVNSISPSKSFELKANAKLTSCVDDTLLFAWSFSDSRVTINTADQNRRVYNIRTGDLPVGATVTVTVAVSLASAPTRSIEASVTLTTIAGPLVADIKGAKKQTIGTTSGQLDLDGSASSDPDGAPGSLVYEWSCVVVETSSTSTCLDPSGSTLPNAGERSASTLSIATSRLLGGKDYRFTLTVSKTSGSSIRTATDIVTVTVVDGTPPQIIIRDIGNNKVSSGSVTSVTAVITSTTSVSFAWEAEVLDGYGFIDVTSSSNIQSDPVLSSTANANIYVTVLYLKANVLQRGTKYSFKCTATANGKVASATQEIYVYNGVSSCAVSHPASYTELSEVIIKVTKCFSDSDGLPLTYTLYQSLNGNNKATPITPTQDNGEFTVSQGPKNDGNGKTVFAVEVCAQVGGCSIYLTGEIDVTEISTADLQAKKTSVLNNIAVLQKESNPLAAVMQLGIYMSKLQSVGLSRRRRSLLSEPVLERQKRHAVTTSELAALQITLVNTTLNTMQLKETVANSLLGVLGALPASSTSDSDILVVTSFYLTLTNYFQSNNIKMATANVQHVQTWLTSVNARSVTGADVTELTTKVTLAARVGFQLGQTETFNLPTSTRRYMYILLSTNHLAKDTNGTVIDFGATLQKQFAQWTCSSGTCEGVGVELTTSNTDTDPYSTLNTDISLRAADVMDIVLTDPKSGTEITGLSSFADPVTMTFVVTRPQSASTFTCKYWNTATSKWDTTGMAVSSQTSSTVSCTSNHLTAFTTFADSSPSSSGERTGWVVGVVFGGIIAMCVVVGIAIVVALVINKKNKVNIVEAINPPLTPHPRP